MSEASMESEGKRKSLYENVSDADHRLSSESESPRHHHQAEAEERAPGAEYKNVSNNSSGCTDDSFGRVLCPNDCGKVLESDDEIERHIAGDCPLTMVDCDFKHVGCEVRLPRRALPTHLGQAVVLHLSLQTERYEERIKMLETDNERLAVKCKRLETEHKELEKKFDELFVVVNKIRGASGNQKLCNGQSRGYVNTGFSLDSQDSNCLPRVSSEPPSLMTAHRQPTSSLTNSPTVPRPGVESDNDRYINADAIHESLKNVNYSYVFTKSQSNSPVPIPPPSSRCEAQSLTMTNFEQHQLNDDHWVSQPFYTHPHGYMMCLRVTANGQGSGKGTHLTVGVYLMKGEFDDQLEWPFRSDIMIELLNQEGNSEHYAKTIRGAKGERSEETGGEKFISGWGISRFISFSKLSPKYLRDDSLRFQISTVHVAKPTNPTALPTQLIETEV